MTVARDYLGDEDMPEVRLLAGRITAAIEADRTRRTPDVVAATLRAAATYVRDCVGDTMVAGADPFDHAARKLEARAIDLAIPAAQPRGEKL